MSIPVVVINTDGTELTYTSVNHPEGCKGISGRDYTKAQCSVTIFLKGDTIYSSTEYSDSCFGATIRIRGNSSPLTPKKPYKIHLDKKADLVQSDGANMHSNKNWVLIKQELKTLNQFIGCAVSKIVGMKWTPRGRFVNLVIDGDFKGLYYISENISCDKSDRVNVDDSGFLIEWDPYFWNEDVYFSTPMTERYPYMNYTVKYPEMETDGDLARIPSISNMVTTAENAVFDGTYSNYIDTQTFANWLLCHDILGNTDALGSNIFLTKYDSTENSKLEMGPLWDFEAIRKASTWAPIHNMYLFSQLLTSNNIEFKQLYCQKWDNIRNNFYTQLCEELDSLKQGIAGKDLELSTQWDNNRWKTTFPTLHEDVDSAKEYFSKRLLFLDSAINEIYKKPLDIIVTDSIQERNDIDYFLCVDSIRRKIIYADAVTKSKLYALNDFDSEGELFCDLRALNSDFTGTMEFASVLPDGNYLIYENRKNECKRLWKLWPEKSLLKTVFVYRNVYQSMKFNWSLTFDTDSKKIYLSEYGVSGNNPENPENPNQELGYKGGATRIWCSNDNGESWNVFYDFMKRDDIHYDHFHIHCIYYDKFTKRLYVSSGDGWVEDGKSNKRLWWFEHGDSIPNSRDWRYYWGNTNNAYSHGQLVSLYADRDFIIAGGDDYNNCIYYINKAENPEDMQLKIVYKNDPSLQGIITQYTSKIRKLSNGLIVTMLVNGDGDGFPRQTRLVGSYDGISWQNLFEGQLENENFNLFNYGYYDEWNEYLYFQVREKYDGVIKPRLIKMALPHNISQGINDLPIGNSVPKIYDLNGRPVNEVHKGIYIYKYADGHSKKVILN